MKLILKPQVTILLFFIIFTTACTKEDSKPKPEMKIKTYLPTEEVDILEKVKSFYEQAQTFDVSLRNEDERIDAGEAMWLMEAAANYAYNRNAKYKKDLENLSLDFELSFKLEQVESRQPTLSKNEVMQEVETLHRTIDNRAKSLKRLPRLVDYEVASIKNGVVNFKVQVILVMQELRDSYDETVKYGLPELSKKAYNSSNNTFDINYNCANNHGTSLPAQEYAQNVVSCIETNYGQYFATSVATARSHYAAPGECYDDGYYDEYAMEGEVWSHGNYNHTDAGAEAIDLWNGDMAAFTPPISSPLNPNLIAYGPQTLGFEFVDESSALYWCIKSVLIGKNNLYSND